MEGIATVYAYGKEIIFVILIPLGIMVWKLRGEVSKLITKDDAQRYVDKNDLHAIIDNTLRKFAGDSLELETKFVSYNQCRAFRAEMNDKMFETTGSIAKEFSKSLHEVMALTKDLSIEVKNIGKQINELVNTIAIQQAEYKKDIEHKEELRKSELQTLKSISEALTQLDDKVDGMSKQLNEHEGYIKACKAKIGV